MTRAALRTRLARHAKTLTVSRGPVVWIFATVALAVVKTRPWLGISQIATVAFVALACGCAVVFVDATRSAVSRRPPPPLLIGSSVVVWAVLPVAVAVQYWGSDPGFWTIPASASFVVAWSLSVERLYAEDRRAKSLPVRFVIIGLVGVVEMVTAFSAYYWIVPWVQNAARSADAGWHFQADWLIQAVVLTAIIAAVYAATGSRRYWRTWFRKWSMKDTITLSLSALALLVSIVGLGYPLANTAAREHLSAKAYIEGLAQPGAAATNIARFHAEPGSPAAGFAQRITLIWQGSSTGSTAFDYGASDENGNFGTRFRFCLPRLATFPMRCAVAENFSFSSSGLVRDFTLNGIPVAALFESNDLSSRAWSELQPQPTGLIRVKQVASLRALSGTGPATTVVFEVDDSGQGWSTTYRLTDVSLDSGGRVAEKPRWYPLQLTGSDYAQYWAVRLPASDGHLDLCVSESGSAHESCLTYQVFG